MGVIGSNMYSLFLSFFYLTVVRYNITERKFKEKYEDKVHILFNLLIWSSNISLVAAGYFNFSPGVCFISPVPMNCINNPDVECIRG